MRLDLRKLILALSLLAVLITFGNTFYAGYAQQRELLIRNTLDANAAYASKMADLTEGFLQQAIQQLGYSARLLGADFDDAALQTAETGRMLQQNQTFNSVFIVNAQGKLINISPPLSAALGTQVSSEELLEVLRAREPRVSEPFVAKATSRLIITISQPIFDSQGGFLGFIAGTVHLHAQNGLHSVLSEHHYQNGSYLFVIDRQGKLIFHRDQARVGQNVLRNPVVQTVLRGDSGSSPVVNTLGQNMLAGYAPVSSTGWGVVVQRPTELTLALLTQQMTDMLLKVAPLLVLTLIAIWYLTRLIATPLHDLARITSTLDEAGTAERIRRVPSWYYEAIKLKNAILSGLNLVQRKITRLNHESLTDALTGLVNRRGMDETLKAWEQAGTPFAVATIDIDHFKSINDTHGHDVGDQILAFLAERMRQSARGVDVLCRNGGDEFTLLLPDTRAREAARVCERLAAAVAQEEAAPGIGITLSMGVADFDGSSARVEEALKAADVALYQAKARGRNQIAVFTGASGENGSASEG
ncbi:MAG: Response regulator PleD [Paracidovorax wautersii]|uniref:diguanylate cyclase n=1 Tax=Paracidovorax wautersii TaxID=1177982 RepID=A0A7V8JQ91_9BURK|nr:MAG: Response regulator PleD [Paracidovorax wautersii]